MLCVCVNVSDTNMYNCTGALQQHSLLLLSSPAHAQLLLLLQSSYAMPYSFCNLLFVGTCQKVSRWPEPQRT